MKKNLLVLLALLMTGLLALAAEVNLTGDWDFTMTTPRGERKSDLNIVQTGEKLAVIMKSTNQQGEAVESKGEGTVKGNDVEFSITRTTPRGEFTMTYKGKIENENTISGTVEMGERGSMEWKAVRKTK